MAKTEATPRPNWGIVIVRVTIGMALVHAGGQKLVQGVGPWIIESTAHRVASAPFFFTWWGNEVLLRWLDAFAQLLSWGCLFLGGLLFLGALVRPVGWAIACAVSRAGRQIGFDELLESRLPTWLTWVRS